MLPNKEHKAKQYLEVIPVLLLLVNMGTYIYFLLSEGGIIKPINEIYLSIRHFFESSGITLFVLWCISKQWKQFSVNCLYLLILYWVSNIPYVIFNLEIELYFSICSLTTYSIFVILIVRYILTGR